jgi:hypothetical protein
LGDWTALLLSVDETRSLNPGNMMEDHQFGKDDGGAGSDVDDDLDDDLEQRRSSFDIHDHKSGGLGLSRELFAAEYGLDSTSESSEELPEPSLSTIEAANAAKASIVKYYNGLFSSIYEREQRHAFLVTEWTWKKKSKFCFFATFLGRNFSTCPHPFAFLTFSIANYRRLRYEQKMDQIGLGDGEKEERRKKLDLIETQFLRARRIRLKKDTFQTISVIGRGSFGEVRASTSLMTFRDNFFKFSAACFSGLIMSLFNN